MKTLTKEQYDEAKHFVFVAQENPLKSLDILENTECGKYIAGICKSLIGVIRFYFAK